MIIAILCILLILLLRDLDGRTFFGECIELETIIIFTAISNVIFSVFGFGAYY